MMQASRMSVGTVVAWGAASAREGGIQAYLEQYLGASEQDYQQRVGGLDAIRAIALPTY